MTLTRLESFPFDSRYDGFDDEGYPVYDRAVGAKTMRDVFAHFFSDGVFSDTTYPFRLTKAASGLAVTVNPGVIIINGGWGILPEATTLTLATGTTAGVIKYAVFARYDNNDEHRTIYLRTDASSAGGAVPEPSTTEANVTEYRIGYITVPSNSTNLTNATITNEVGTSKCPYAVPLFDIDPAEVLEDLRNDAQAAFDKYYALLLSAVDGTTAGYLQAQIDEILSNPQAIRAAMGLGDTLGVLGVEYGGTGRSGPEPTGLLCSFSIKSEYEIPTTGAEALTIPMTYENVYVADEDVVSFADRTLTLKGQGFYKIAVSGTVAGSGGKVYLVDKVVGTLCFWATPSISGKVYSFPGAASASPFSTLAARASNKISTDANGVSSSNYYADPTSASLNKSTDVLKDPFSDYTVTFPSAGSVKSTESENYVASAIASASGSDPFVVILDATVEIRRAVAL